MPRTFCTLLLTSILSIVTPDARAAKPKVFAPATGQPGDGPIHAYLAAEAERLEASLFDGLTTAEDWAKAKPQLMEEYFYMLGLAPMPERTPLKATITGKLEQDGYTVEMIHYQSRPGLYVTANLYRPALIREGERLPAVLYVCGHSNQGRNGNKTSYQAQPIWFGRHGYVCLAVDSLQLGEIASIHHGTYREQRWWWHSRGYTPAGVEAWNGVRGIDYLVSRPDVDPDRIAVTGLSGGGAATYWIAAADERVKVAVPVSGMADLPTYVGRCFVDGHCDCMFMYNTFRWPWTRIAALIAPRPMLFVNSDADPIFPMGANEPIAARMEMFYRLFGAGDMFDAMVSIGGHAYRKDIRQGVCRFINMHLKNDARVVDDTEIDVPQDENPGDYAIPLEKLRVFPRDEDLPRDAINARIDETFVPIAKPALPKGGDFDSWKTGLLKELRRVTFTGLAGAPRSAQPAAKLAPGTNRLMTDPGIEIALDVRNATVPSKPAGIDLLIAGEGEAAPPLQNAPDRLAIVCYPRGTGPTRWTHTNPPNTVERSFALIGETADTARVRDVIAAVRRLASEFGDVPITMSGAGREAVIAAYAAALEPAVTQVSLIGPPASHMDSEAPQFLNVLRVLDIPEACGLIAPRRLSITTGDGAFERTQAIYAAAGAGDALPVRK